MVRVLSWLKVLSVIVFMILVGIGLVLGYLFMLLLEVLMLSLVNLFLICSRVFIVIFRLKIGVLCLVFFGYLL